MDGRLNADDLMFASVRARYLESPGTVAGRLRAAARKPGGLDGVTPAQALVAAGRLLTDAGELDEAVTILRAAADLAPAARDDHGARIALAIALALSGDSQPAEVLFRGGLSNRAGLGFGQRVQAALALAAAGQEAEAVGWADAALEHARKKRMGREAEGVARKLQGTVRTHAAAAAARRARPAAPGGAGGGLQGDDPGDDSGRGGSDAFGVDDQNNTLGGGDQDRETSEPDDSADDSPGADDQGRDATGGDDQDSDGAEPEDQDEHAVEHDDRDSDAAEPEDQDGDTPGRDDPDDDAPSPHDPDGHAPEPDDLDDVSGRADLAATPGAEPDAEPGPDAVAGSVDDGADAVADDDADRVAGDGAGGVAVDGAAGTVAAPPALATAADGTVLWWPQSEYLRLARQLPGLAGSMGPGWAGHTARTEAGLRARASCAPGRIALIAADFGQFATYLRKGGLDPREPGVLAGYAAVAAANGTLTAWPPWPLRACWCGSGRRYRNCCAVRGAAISAG